jgi:hypothetical protein
MRTVSTPLMLSLALGCSKAPPPRQLGDALKPFIEPPRIRKVSFDDPLIRWYVGGATKDPDNRIVFSGMSRMTREGLWAATNCCDPVRPLVFLGDEPCDFLQGPPEHFRLDPPAEASHVVVSCPMPAFGVTPRLWVTYTPRLAGRHLSFYEQVKAAALRDPQRHVELPLSVRFGPAERIHSQAELSVR